MMSCNFLSKKIKQWFNESFSGGENEFTFRFRGKESNSFLRNFPKLILFVSKLIDRQQLKQRLLEIQVQCKHLRKILSLSVPIVNFNREEVDEMKVIGKQLFKVCCLFDQNVLPSLWTLYNATPIHAQLYFNDFNLGLGSNTMEGREQKHQAISKYAHNTTFQNH